jgi:hypothetical protein
LRNSMATLVFSTVGTALGGPIGGAIGSMVGRQFDTAVFGSPHRSGPRLKELEVSTSSYGQAIPRHFGRMRVPGSIIWATELVEHSETHGGGKGAPSVTTYSYTANFAVALASRRIVDVGRIWADGKLMRGAAGDLKTGGELRIHKGEADQPVDPLIAANEGADRCPAYRGLAYAVFENLDLSEYHNRIPALTFEVIADETFRLQEMATEDLANVDARVALDGVAGWTSEGPLADTLGALGQVIGLHADAAGETLVISRERLQEEPIQLAEPAVSVDDEDFGGASGFSRHRAPPPEQPVALLRYFDTGRDYLPGLQHASGRPAPGEPRTIELPAALDAGNARKLIERASRKADWTRDRLAWRTCELDPRATPGAIVTAPGLGGRWRVLEWEWRQSGIELLLERVAPIGADKPPALATDTGRASVAEDLPPARTALVACELPLDSAGGGYSEVARLCAAVSGNSANWSGAALYADRGDGQLIPLGPSGRTRCTIGTTLTAPGPASPLLFDRTSEVVVRLVDPAMELMPASARQLAFGANLALIGEEIVQFASATRLDGGAWRLGGLVRGRGGTEGAICAHAAGESFVLLDNRLVSLNPGVVGANGQRIVALGRGDEEPVETPVLLRGITLRPLAPVHPRQKRLVDGTMRLEWTRRARGEWVWRDGIDVPLVEQSESYLITLGPLEAPLAMWATTVPVLDIGASLLAELTASASGQPIRARQQGTHALSPPLLLCTLP